VVVVVVVASPDPPLPPPPVDEVLVDEVVVDVVVDVEPGPVEVLLVLPPPHPANPAARPPVTAKSATLNP
jgi:hypothetical protein